MWLIPNKGTSLNTLQSRLFSQYLDVLVAGTTRTNFVVSGCDVVAQGAPNMTAAVGAGTIITNGEAHVVAGGNATIPTAHSSLPRLDLVVITSGGAIAVRQGTAAASPIPPDRSANDTVLAVVYVPAAVTAITNGHIVDLRIVNASITKNDVGLGDVVNLDTSNPANIAQSASYRFVTDSEKSTWNGKQAALISGTNIKTINGESILGAGNIVISGGGGVSLGETDTTAYRGDRGKIAYDHSQLTHDKAFVGLGNVPNVDATNPANTVQTASYRFVTDTEKGTWNAKQDALISGTNIKTINGSSVLGAGNLAVGNALTTNDLSQFAATTSAQLRGVISDESGTGALLFGTSPTIATPIINVGSDATGDIYYRSAGGAFTRLGVTTNGYVLTLVAGLPAWAAAGGGGGASYDESNPILDSSSNELAQFFKIPTAVNHVAIANASTTNAPILGATGDDSNVNLNLQWKGTGFVDLGANPAVGTPRTALRYRESSVDMFKVESTTSLSNATRLTLGYSNGIICTGNGTGPIVIESGNYISAGLCAKDGVEIGNALHYWFPTSVRSIFDVKPVTITNYENGTDGSVSRFRVTQFDGNISGRTLTNSATVQIDGAPTQTANITITNKYALWVKGGSSKFDGAICPASLANAAAPNNSVYYSTDALKLVYKDSSGTVNNLY